MFASTIECGHVILELDAADLSVLEAAMERFGDDLQQRLAPTTRVREARLMRAILTIARLALEPPAATDADGPATTDTKATH